MFEHIAVRRRPGNVNEGVLDVGWAQYRCALGRGGTTVLKREGDGCTPAQATMRPRFAYWRSDRLTRRPVCSLPLNAISAQNGWCDDVGHPMYNQPVRLPSGASHERMMRDDCLYDLCVVLDWNMTPKRARHLGSAIFMHVAKPGYRPTLGCIALALPDLLQLVARLSLATKITVFRQS
ncbi:MAG: L,D-transpeptidase family protein [Pseudomonadota bacterium]